MIHQPVKQLPDAGVFFRVPGNGFYAAPGRITDPGAGAKIPDFNFFLTLQQLPANVLNPGKNRLRLCRPDYFIVQVKNKGRMDGMGIARTKIKKKIAEKQFQCRKRVGAGQPVKQNAC